MTKNTAVTHKLTAFTKQQAKTIDQNYKQKHR